MLWSCVLTRPYPKVAIAVSLQVLEMAARIADVSGKVQAYFPNTAKVYRCCCRKTDVFLQSDWGSQPAIYDSQSDATFALGEEANSLLTLRCDASAPATTRTASCSA